MTATRRGEGFGRSASDAALRGALLVAVAVIIGALLIWRGHNDDNDTNDHRRHRPRRTVDGVTTAKAGHSGNDAGRGDHDARRDDADRLDPPGQPGQGARRQRVRVDGYATQVHQKLVTGGLRVARRRERQARVRPDSFIYYRDGYQEDARAMAVFLGADGNIVQAMPASLADRLEQAVLNKAQTRQYRRSSWAPINK